MTRALAGVAALLLAACGGGTETSRSGAATELAPTEPTAVGAATPGPAALEPAPSEPSAVESAPTEPTSVEPALPAPMAAAPAPTEPPTPTAELPSAAASVPESLACASHDDCVLVLGVCGGVEPTNRSHEAETREGVELRRTVASCAAPSRREPRMLPRCNAGRCMAIEPP